MEFLTERSRVQFTETIANTRKLMQTFRSVQMRMLIKVFNACS